MQYYNIVKKCLVIGMFETRVIPICAGDKTELSFISWALLLGRSKKYKQMWWIPFLGILYDKNDEDMTYRLYRLS